VPSLNFFITMASLWQAASILADRAGKRTDITFIQQMKDLVVIKRARIIANSLSKSSNADRFYLQSFDIDLKLIDKTDECSQEVPECCDKAWKTIDKIPQPIRYGVHPFNYVGGPGGNMPFGYTTFGTEYFMQKRPIAGKRGRYTYSNDYIYTFNKEVPFIRIEGVFSDPRKVAKFRACGTTTPCYSDEQEFPIDEQNLEIIIKDITNELRFNLPDQPTQVKIDHDQ